MRVMLVSIAQITRNILNRLAEGLRILCLYLIRIMSSSQFRKLSNHLILIIRLALLEVITKLTYRRWDYLPNQGTE